MKKRLNSVSSAETKDERTTNDDVASTVHHHNSNTIVARSQSLKAVIVYLLSDECSVEIKSLAFSHFLSIVVSLVALVVSLIAFFQV